MTIDRLPTVRRSLSTVHCSLLAGFLLLTAVMMGGCAEKSTSNHYYYPNWNPDGKIVCVKKVVSTSSGSYVFPGHEDVRYFVSTMNQDGTGETDIKEINKMGIVAASPLGNYLAVTELNNLKIFTASGVDVKTIDLNERINSFDWSPDEARIAYSTDVSKDLCIVSISDEVKTKIAPSAEGVAWRVGKEIVYEGIVNNIYTYLFTIRQDASNNTQLSISGLEPQKTNNGKIIYRGIGTSIQSVNISGTDESTLIADYSRASLRLSFDNLSIVGGDLDGYGDIAGIWVYKIDGTERKQLR